MTDEPPTVTEQAQRLNIPAVWPPTGMRPVAVNQVLVQPGPPVGPDGAPDGFYLIFGQLAPPIVMPGSTQEQLQAVAATPLQISTEAYLFLTRERFQAMAGSITAMLNLIKEGADEDR